MPNVKFFVDRTNCPMAHDTLSGMLPSLRTMICDALAVEPAACQFAVIEVAGLDDQPRINAELQIMPRPGRTPENLNALVHNLRDVVTAATGLHVAVRLALLAPADYIALK